jgi:hypothetical protein
MKHIHESVAQVISGAGVKLQGSKLDHANNRASLYEHEIVGSKKADGSVTVTLQGHPVLSGAEFTSCNIQEAAKLCLKLCAKSSGFPILSECKDGEVTCTFTKDKAKATISEEAQAAKLVTEEEEEDETDGTGEPSNKTTTSTKTKNDPAKTKKDTKVVDKGDEVVEGEKPEFLKKMKEKKGKRDALADKKEKSKEECDEMAKLDAELDTLSEQFYDSLDHTVTFVLYEGEKAEVHGLTEEEIAPFGGTAPTVPAKYAKKAKDAGPNSKVDMGVLTLHKAEDWKTQGSKILTGKDFKAAGWGTPGKGYGKQSRWSDTGKQPMDAAKKLPAGTEK